MINTHTEILNLYPSTKALIKRISEEFEGRITTDKLKALGFVIRSSRNRGKIGISLWEYLIKVSAADYEHGESEILITAQLLHDTRPQNGFIKAKG